VTQPSAFDASLQAAKFYNDALIGGNPLPMASTLPATTHQYLPQAYKVQHAIPIYHHPVQNEYHQEE
jgi:hypothetical protein